MATVDPTALARLLDAVDLRVGMARRAPLQAHARLPLVSGAAALVYVRTGRVHGRAPLSSGCRLDAEGGSCIVSIDDDSAVNALIGGDAFLTLGRSAFTLEADIASDLVIVDLEFSEEALTLAAVLPDPITVTSFDALEPAAAALAGSMGPDDDPALRTREGDPLICRMMATTVLLSVIRAWAAEGCAPEGWPLSHALSPTPTAARTAARLQDPGTSAGSYAGFVPADVPASRTRTQDPFLDRVVDAIHDEPGREWTVERLANMGAMSRSAFAERFRTTIGRSPADYVAEVRIDLAKGMLSAGQSVSETSRALGYASDEGFSRAFRRRIGMTPSSWRAEHPVPA